jgi:hypothetical protein
MLTHLRRMETRKVIVATNTHTLLVSAIIKEPLLINEKLESIFTTHEMVVTRTTASGLWLPLFSKLWR